MMADTKTGTKTGAGALVSREALVQRVKAEVDTSLSIVAHKNHDDIAVVVFPTIVSIVYWRCRLSIVRDQSEVP